MKFAAWVDSVGGFLRDRPGRVAATAGAFVAIVVAAWWLGSQRGVLALSRVDQTAASPGAPYVPVPVPVLPPLPAPKGAELCGSGSMPVVDGGLHLAADMEASMLAADSALDRLAADLAARSTARERALGLYLRMVTARFAAHGDRDVLGAAAESQAALVRLATSTHDANSYALAIFSCGQWVGNAGNGDCYLLSYAQWARIEPDNAVPWLYLAAEAEGRGDQSTVEEALYRA